MNIFINTKRMSTDIGRSWKQLHRARYLQNDQFKTVSFIWLLWNRSLKNVFENFGALLDNLLRKRQKHQYLGMCGFVFLNCNVISNKNSKQRPFKFNFTGLEIIYNPLVGKGGGVIRIDSTGQTVVDFFYESNMKLFGPIYVSMDCSNPRYLHISFIIPNN